MHPERDIDWYNEERKGMGQKRTAQEIDCDFLGSGYNVFEMAKIRAIEDRLRERPPLHEKMNGQLLYYFDPVPGEQYHLGADIASGRARDYSAFSVFNQAGKEMACFKGKILTREFAHLMGSVGQKYNWAWLAPERNAIGEGPVAMLQDNGYPNLYHTYQKLMKLDEFEPEMQAVAD